MRRAVVTPRRATWSVPARPLTEVRSTIARSVCPATAAVSAGALPRKGTPSVRSPAIWFSNSVERCMAVPLPPCATVSAPGRARAAARSFGQGSDAEARAGDEDEGDAREKGDGREVARDVVGHGGIEAGVHRQRAGRADAERVPVRRRLGDGVHADVAAGAGAVVDDQRLAEPGLHAGREDAADDVAAAARREGDDEADRAAGEGGLGARAGRPRGRRRGGRGRSGGARGAACP